VLAGRRMLDQTRRVGLLKAVGPRTRTVAAILLAEHFVMALAAAALGIGVGRLLTPSLATAGAGLVGAPGAADLTAATVALPIALSPSRWPPRWHRRCGRPAAQQRTLTVPPAGELAVILISTLTAVARLTAGPEAFYRTAIAGGGAPVGAHLTMTRPARATGSARTSAYEPDGRDEAREGQDRQAAGFDGLEGPVTGRPGW